MGNCIGVRDEFQLLQRRRQRKKAHSSYRERMTIPDEVLAARFRHAIVANGQPERSHPQHPQHPQHHQHHQHRHKHHNSQLHGGQLRDNRKRDNNCAALFQLDSFDHDEYDLSPDGVCPHQPDGLWLLIDSLPETFVDQQRQPATSQVASADGADRVRTKPAGGARKASLLMKSAAAAAAAAAAASEGGEQTPLQGKNQAELNALLQLGNLKVDFKNIGGMERLMDAGFTDEMLAAQALRDARLKEEAEEAARRAELAVRDAATVAAATDAAAAAAAAAATTSGGAAESVDETAVMADQPAEVIENAEDLLNLEATDDAGAVMESEQGAAESDLAQQQLQQLELEQLQQQQQLELERLLLEEERDQQMQLDADAAADEAGTGAELLEDTEPEEDSEEVEDEDGDEEAEGEDDEEDMDEEEEEDEEDGEEEDAEGDEDGAEEEEAEDEAEEPEPEPEAEEEPEEEEEPVDDARDDGGADGDGD